MQYLLSLFLWMTIIKGVIIRGHLPESHLNAYNDTIRNVSPTTESVPTTMAATDITLVPSPTSFPSNSVTTLSLTNNLGSRLNAPTNLQELTPLKGRENNPSNTTMPIDQRHVLSSSFSSSLPRSTDSAFYDASIEEESSEVFGQQLLGNTYGPLLSPVRNDLPKQLDSEESTNTRDEPFFLKSTSNAPSLDFLHMPLNLSIPNYLVDHTLEVPLTKDISVREGNTSHETDAELKAESSGFTSPPPVTDVLPSPPSLSVAPNTIPLTSESVFGAAITTFTPTAFNNDITSSDKPLDISPITTTTAPISTTGKVSRFEIHQQNKSDFYSDLNPSVKKIISSTQFPEVITLPTSSPLELSDRWTWFYMVLRGNCHFVDLRHSDILFNDFINSFSDLLLYNREHMVIESMTCTGRRMTVNMSIDSVSYPNCDKDLRTLLSHRNLRVNLHNASFHIHSYETKRTLIFETKEDVKEKNSDILYLTMGAVGISLVCIMFGGALFTIYQYSVVKKAKSTGNTSKYTTESPRSLKPKFEMDQSMSYSDQRTFSINMYKSYSDLTASDLYGNSRSQNNNSVKGKLKTPKKTVILTRIPKEKNKKKKKDKKICQNGYGFSDSEAYHEFWSESVTQTNEDFVSVRNLNTMTSTFKNKANESEIDSLHPLLKQQLVTPDKKLPHDDLLPPLQPPPPSAPCYAPSTCPSSPDLRRGVLDRMDQLLANNYSSSTPDINAGTAYTRTYSTTTINYSHLPSTDFHTVGGNDFADARGNCKSNVAKKHSAPAKVHPHSADKKTPALTSASAENLCLTRITFMGMDNPSFRIETDM